MKRTEAERRVREVMGQLRAHTNQQLCCCDACCAPFVELVVGAFIEGLYTAETIDLPLPERSA